MLVSGTRLRNTGNCDRETAMTVWICAACGVEQPDTPESPQACAICLDERQYVPRTGQRWLSLPALSENGYRIEIEEVEPELYGIVSRPAVGIGQRTLLIRTDAGNLLWDPIGFVDEAAAHAVRQLGDVAAIVASHPHMYGAQVEWSRLLGGVPVYAAEQDRVWIQRPDACIQTFSGDLQVLPGVVLHTIGGHFPGSVVAVWPSGAGGSGVLLAGDGIFPNPNGTWVSFLRSYPNMLPLSAAVVDRLARRALELPFDRLYGNFGGVVDHDAHGVIRRSADRYMAWVRGDFDGLT
jgi:glyoxylase-like metal-dependent hydrolase (beta-lactamase superfamily II)